MVRSRSHTAGGSFHATDRGRFHFVLLALMAAIFLLTAAVPAAWGAPDELTARRAEVLKLKAQIEALDVEISHVVEDYDEAQVLLGEAKDREVMAEAAAVQARDDFHESQDVASVRLRGAYMSDRLGIFHLILTSSDIAELMARARGLRDILAADRDTLTDLESRREELVRREQELTAEREERERIAAELEVKRERVLVLLDRRQKELASAEKDVVRLVEEERAREEAERAAALAQEASRLRAAALAEAERRAATTSTTKATATTTPPTTTAASPPSTSTRTTTGATASTGTTGTTSPSGTTTTRPPTTTTTDPPSAPPPSSVGARVVEIAKTLLGIPYVWAGESTSGFDCSGLTKYVYAKVGIQLPHSSRMQFGMGTAVGYGDLAPGDLVFFGNPIHHVGIYVGGGNYLHAPYTGSVVKISSMGRSDYAGARRY
ncbi:MAG: C40 family peptidase [Actinobacteria bacterium]|nr:C40 family peptidase [Actinomycetota bacterium]